MSEGRVDIQSPDVLSHEDRERRREVSVAMKCLANGFLAAGVHPGWVVEAAVSLACELYLKTKNADATKEDFFATANHQYDDLAMGVIDNVSEAS